MQKRHNLNIRTVFRASASAALAFALVLTCTWPPLAPAFADEAPMLATAAATSTSISTSTFTATPLQPSRAYPLPATILSPENRWTFRQYGCAAANGTYLLQGADLHFFSLATGDCTLAHTFPSSSNAVFFANDKLYWTEGGQVIVYDLVTQREAVNFTIPGVASSYAIGADAAGRIYLSVGEQNSAGYKIYLLSPQGTLLSSMATDEMVDEFAGFDSNGTFFFIAYYNYRYWGYDHDTESLFTAQTNGSQLVEGSIEFVDTMYQIYFDDHNEPAQMIADHRLATMYGILYDTSNMAQSGLTALLNVGRARDPRPAETVENTSPTSAYYESDQYFPAIGARMTYNAQANTATAYTGAKNIFEYDLATNKPVRKANASHYVFSLASVGDRLVAIEVDTAPTAPTAPTDADPAGSTTPTDQYYIEVLDATSFAPVQSQLITLNDTAPYQGHTKKAVEARRAASIISNKTKVYATTYKASPYRAPAYTKAMKNALLDYSNYLRWLGGLTEFSSAEAGIWSNASKAAMLLTSQGSLTHSPSKPEDMDDATFNAAYDGCSNSNLSSAGVPEGGASRAMDAIRGLLDDTNNVSSNELGHRFEFLQRSGYQLAYGSTPGRFVQTVVDRHGQENRTGTIVDVDNNDYCYAWPAPGAFPTDAISTKALWSFNLNTSKIRPSSAPMSVVIQNLATGETFDMSSSVGSSAYFGFNDYFDYFKGACYYFNPPKATSYAGKRFKVTVDNLELPDGTPATMSYTVQFYKPSNSKASARKISKAKVMIGRIGQVKGGASLDDLLVVRDGKKTLKRGIDYETDWWSSTWVKNRLTSATTTIRGIGDYKGKRKVTLKPIAKHLSVKVSKRTGGILRLTWKAQPSAAGYRIYRSTNGAAYKKVATLKTPKKKTWTDKRPPKSPTTYKVRAFTYTPKPHPTV